MSRRLSVQQRQRLPLCLLNFVDLICGLRLMVLCELVIAALHSCTLKTLRVLQAFCRGGTYWRVTRQLPLPLHRAIRLLLLPRLQVRSLVSDPPYVCFPKFNMPFANFMLSVQPLF